MSRNMTPEVLAHYELMAAAIVRAVKGCEMAPGESGVQYGTAHIDPDDPSKFITTKLIVHARGFGAQHEEMATRLNFPSDDT